MPVNGGDELKQTNEIGMFMPLLDAIDKSGDDRGAVASALFGMKVTDGITGNFTITDTGDPDVSPITISKAGKEFEPIQVVEPKANLINAARGQ